MGERATTQMLAGKHEEQHHKPGSIVCSYSLSRNRRIDPRALLDKIAMSWFNERCYQKIK